jgi:hypothetical protein
MYWAYTLIYISLPVIIHYLTTFLLSGEKWKSHIIFAPIRNIDSCFLPQSAGTSQDGQRPHLLGGIIHNTHQCSYHFLEIIITENHLLLLCIFYAG